MDLEQSSFLISLTLLLSRYARFRSRGFFSLSLLVSFGHCGNTKSLTHYFAAHHRV
jgi:hypothetical protein